MNQYTTGQFAKLIGKHPNTLRNWDKKGVLKARRTPTGYRYYTDQHLKDLGLYELVSK